MSENIKLCCDCRWARDEHRGWTCARFEKIHTDVVDGEVNRIRPACAAERFTLARGLCGESAKYWEPKPIEPRLNFWDKIKGWFKNGK